MEPLPWVGCCCAGIQGSVRERFAPVSTLISGALSSATFLKLPLGQTEVHTQQLSLIALDSPFLSASRLAVSIPRLTSATREDRIKRGGGRWGCCVSAEFCRTNENNSVSDSFQQNCPPRMLLYTQSYQIWNALISNFCNLCKSSTQIYLIVNILHFTLYYFCLTAVFNCQISECIFSFPSQSLKTTHRKKLGLTLQTLELT